MPENMNISFYYLLIPFVLTVIVYIIVNTWRRTDWCNAAKSFQGPLAFPIIGNAYLFMCSDEKILMRIHGVSKRYIPQPIRFWLGPWLMIAVLNPEHVKKILLSNKCSQKHDIYKFPKIFLGEGLITSSGPINTKHRKIIKPLFGPNFAQESTSCMQKHIALCMQRLESYVDKGNFDFIHLINPCMADIIKETILGADERSQINGTTEFDEVVLQAYELSFTRMAKPWLQPDILFNMTSLKKKQDKLRRIVHSLGKIMVEKAFIRRKILNQAHEFHPIIDQIADYIEENEGAIDVEHFIDHILTLYVASEDTMTIISAFLAMCLGMYPKYQERAAKEIRDIFGVTPRPVTTDDIPKLKFIDMCIKETLRLFPIAPIILRKCSADFQIEKWVIPKDCAIVIPIFTLHRDPSAWEKPNEFYPEHFLPEAESKRHDFSYIPFSAGPRGCLGKILSHTGLKIFICNLLQRYEIEADGNVPDLKIKMDISTRPINGCYLRLKKRIWK